MNIKEIFILVLILLIYSMKSEDECSKSFSEYKSLACSNVYLGKEGKECVYINGNCVERDDSCESYIGLNASECEAIIPGGGPSPIKCTFVNGKCREAQKTCSDYKYGQYNEFCEYIYNNGKGCRYSEGKCYDDYFNCEEYTGEDKNICEAINPQNQTQKCVFNEEEGCKAISDIKKTCEISDLYYCSDIILEDTDTHCFISGVKCKDYYKKCSLIKDEEQCNSNIPENYEESICVFENGKCIDKPIDKCLYYLQDSCEQIKLSDEKKYCKYLYDEGCIETYRECELYNGTNQQECELIAPENYTKIKCVFSEGKCKSVERTSCTEDYTLRGLGSYYEICQSIQPKDKNKYCHFSENMCFEYYKNCSLYEGNDESICNKIITEENGACEIKEGKCVDKTEFECSDYDSYLHITLFYSIRYYCEYLPTSNIHKQCVYKVSDNSCTETDKHCYDFAFGATKEICEKAPTLFFWKKCILESGGDKCIMEDKQCKDITLDSVKDTCEKSLASPYRERCSAFIGNDECIIAEKQCSQLSSLIEETCQVAKTSSDNYKCVVSEDKKSCVEKDKNGTHYINSFVVLLFSLILLIL